jgi:hypothetical protein
VHIATELYRRTRALEPDIAGDIYLDISAHEGQREVVPGGHRGLSLPSAQGLGPGPYTPAMVSSQGWTVFGPLPGMCSRYSRAEGTRDAPGSCHRLQRTADSDVC